MNSAMRNISQRFSFSAKNEKDDCLFIKSWIAYGLWDIQWMAVEKVRITNILLMNGIMNYFNQLNLKNTFNYCNVVLGNICNEI